MKKKIAFLAALMLILAGCISPRRPPAVILEKFEPGAALLSSAPNPLPEQAAAPADAVVGQNVLYIWEDDSYRVNIYCAFEIISKGNEPIKIDKVKISGVLGFLSYGADPPFLGPGETAYVSSHYIYYQDQPSEYAQKMEIEVSSSKAGNLNLPVKLGVEKAQFNHDTKTLTVLVYNGTQEYVLGPHIVGGLYDKEGIFLGTIHTYIEGGGLEPGEKRELQEEIQSGLPDDIFERISVVKCISFDDD